MANLNLPAIFAGVATSVSVSLSAVTSRTADVVMTLKFISPPSNSGSKSPIKVISLTGVYFNSFSEIKSPVCYHSGPDATGVASLTSTADQDPKILVIRLYGSDAITSGSVTCDISGFKNLPNQRKTGVSVGLSTWDAQNAPVDTASLVAFPNIFEFAATNGTISLSSQVIGKAGVSMTLKFEVPFLGTSISTISMSGLPFSPLQQQATPSALCSVDKLSPSVNSNSVLFILTNTLATIQISLESGLPVGSELTGQLLVTCTISNLVNAPLPASARPTDSVAVFGINNSPLYFQRSVKFPALFAQSLGFKRPRVRFIHLTI
jgi:hypothetical protein